MHVHLDPVGGIAGDMFVAALVDAWPELVSELPALLAAAGLPETVSMQCQPHTDHGLRGTCLQVHDTGVQPHPHVHFRSIRERLWNSALPARVKERAVSLFTLLAEAEAQVHGIPMDEVVFHEVGAWDSIADIVAAAFLIDALAVASWSISPLPLGSGFVKTEHGLLPVPAPATALLLKDFVVHDDGRAGERITPTGAAILKYLLPADHPPVSPMMLGRTGIGFGSRRLDGIANVLRLIVLEELPERHTDEVAVIHFEVDDQPAEDLALGLERLRNLPTVIDVIQIPVVAKCGRLATQIQMLARPEALDSVLIQCFLETTTLGLRWQIVRRSVLERQSLEYREDGQPIRVKIAQRPDGVLTAKAELRDVAHLGGFAERARRRQSAEGGILRKREKDDE
jgi:uncharacterized protein (TIGR00299 family) protein